MDRGSDSQVEFNARGSIDLGDRTGYRVSLPKEGHHNRTAVPNFGALHDKISNRPLPECLDRTKEAKHKVPYEEGTQGAHDKGIMGGRLYESVQWV